MLKEKIKETSDFLKKKLSSDPHIGIILGSGLKKLKDEVQNPIAIAYSDIPHMPESTVEGHGQELIFGEIGGKRVILFAGRFHYYEGYTMEQVTYPVRIMKSLNCRYMIVSNASGGLNPDLQVGDIMIIRDHINLMPEHPLHGPNDSELGPRFPDMSEPYKYSLIDEAQQIARRLDIPVHEGVYVGVQGPTFETRAEYRYLRSIGGDAVGMSTVPEVIVGIHSGLHIFGISIITDVGIREEMNVITHEEVLEAAENATPKVSRLIKELIPKLNV